jgi:hypothetical protein
MQRDPQKHGGDPAVDFVGLRVWQGRKFVEQTLAHYDGTVDDGFLERVEFRGRCLGLIGLGWVNKQKPERVQVMREFLETAFREDT